MFLEWFSTQGNQPKKDFSPSAESQSSPILVSQNISKAEFTKPSTAILKKRSPSGISHTSTNKMYQSHAQNFPVGHKHKSALKFHKDIAFNSQS